MIEAKELDGELWIKASDHHKAVKVAIEHERDRIKQANAPEIERVNAHIKELEDAVLAEREACAKLCDEHCGWTPRMIGETIRARGQA